ncbi:dUTP diphosphatase [Neobacillus cucumis]|uniref:dUTPase n=1 Tax=Neobacillus cucumis TaxID=1740721 RepID=A0A2N5HAP3_9BACI|nr:dUTP diphosphatase [Neobacillus cucumis]PLS02584.1 dUTPase [Neobacillus cucumis]
MELKKLFEMQKALDAHIEEKHGLEKEDLFDRKVLALLVEIGELANETRCFKFWSVKPSSSKEVVLEEFVDGIHFILSLGIECGFDQETLNLNTVQSSRNVTEQFLAIYESISHFQKSKALENYLKLFESYLMLSILLGFAEDEIVKAYFEKNEVNYQRQQNNY